MSNFSFFSSLKFLNPTHYFKPKHLRIYFTSVIIISLFTFTLLVISIKLKKSKSKALLDKNPSFITEELEELIQRPGINDFLFTDGFIDEIPPQISQGLINEQDFDEDGLPDFSFQYFIKPETLGISTLPDHNQKLIEDYFAEITQKDPNF